MLWEHNVWPPPLMKGRKLTVTLQFLQITLLVVTIWAFGTHNENNGVKMVVELSDREWSSSWGSEDVVPVRVI